MTATALLDRLAPEPGGPRAEDSRAWLDRHGFPTKRDEAWRHTPVDDIVTALLETSPGPEADAVIDPVLLEDLIPDLGGPRLIHVNGRPVLRLSRVDALRPGVRPATADEIEAHRPDGGDDTGEPLDAFEALNRIIGTDPVGLLVDADADGTDPEHPVQLIHLTVPGRTPAGAHPHTIVRLGAHARLHVVEHHVAIGGASVTNALTRFLLGPGAVLEHRRIVRGTDESMHVGRVDIEQLADSRARSTGIAVGGGIVRTAVNATLRGDGARVDLDGLSVPVGRQRHDTVVTVDHAASHGVSTQNFRGIMADASRGNFLGHVIVRPGTVRNDARQSNPNLVLDRRAQADTNPWLEIYADDVACTHGATVGRLDEDALFYLRSRGIPEQLARNLLVAAFAGDVVDHVEPAALRGHLDQLLADRTPGGPIREP